MNDILDLVYLEHTGTPQMYDGDPNGSGRYRQGSGKNPDQHVKDFYGRVNKMRKEGFTYTDPKTGETYSGDKAIYKSMGMTSGQFRTEYTLAKDERRMYMIDKARTLKEHDGLGATEIARKMSTPEEPVSESTVRSWLNSKSEQRTRKAVETANFLKQHVDEKGMIDVGGDIHRELNISKEKMQEALRVLKAEGYEVYSGRFNQVTNPGQMTTQTVLCKPGTEHKEIYQLDKVKTINDYISRDGGDSFEKKFNYPESMDSKRLMIRYKDDVDSMGIKGIDKDGVVELRPGCKDLSLGESKYSQVRILVDGTHYIKGMAVYGDPKDFPPGVDAIFNTNKGKEKSKMEVLKEIKKDPENPFGSAIKDASQGGQYWYDDPKTGKKKLGLINKRSDEGDWSDWKDALPSQFLGKQSKAMAQKQLDLAKADKVAEFDEIKSLTNPTVKKYYLDKFAEGCDSAAVHLQAAALPGQKYHVIIPNGTLKDNEVYAPGYENGTKLALIRYPHGGTFEIPICTVNNKNPLGKKLLGTTPSDAVCINSKVAERLSGADFDGDTVMCIPTHDKSGKVKITSTNPLKGLEGFDPKTSYGSHEVKVDANGEKHYYRDGREYKIMKNTGTQMGVISNLITDMTLAGAGPDKLARAVRHSMVVIDAEKHKLDYKQSEKDNRIAELHKEYQGKTTGGAATLLSRAKGQYSIDKTQGSPKVNLKGKEWYDPTKPEGSLVYKTADDLYYPVRKYDKGTGTMTINKAGGGKVTYSVADKEATAKYAPVKRTDPKTGEVTFTNADGSISYKTDKRKQQTTKMAATNDPYSLVSEYKHPMELIYADYASSMKKMANQARLESAGTGKIATNANAKKVYSAEVKSLDEKLNTALLNSGRERAALRAANVEISAVKAANPDMKTGDIKKKSQQALTKYRNEFGSVSRKDRSIEITDKEWEAIQAGAVSENKLKKILDNSDPAVLRQRAMPKATNALSSAQVNRIKALANSNYTLEQIAKMTGKSTSTISKYLKGGN